MAGSGRYVSLLEAAKLTGRDPKTVKAWIDRGQLVAEQGGTPARPLWRIERERLEPFIAEAAELGILRDVDAEPAEPAVPQQVADLRERVEQLLERAVAAETELAFWRAGRLVYQVPAPAQKVDTLAARTLRAVDRERAAGRTVEPDDPELVREAMADVRRDAARAAIAPVAEATFAEIAAARRAKRDAARARKAEGAGG